MAEGFGLVAGTMAFLGLLPPPREGGSPEDDSAPPVERVVLSRDPNAFLTSAYMGALKANPDDILTRDGGGDLGLFDRLLDDDVAMSNLQQRRLAIISRDWEVTPGDDKDPKSVKAAEDFKEMLDGVGFDRVTDHLHYAIWYGYGVGEALWTTKPKDGKPLIWLDDIVVPDRRWFGYTHSGELRLATMFGGFGGEALPPNKFFSVRTGGTHDFAFYGLGLAHWAYWPVWFKRSITQFWALFLEKLADPTRIAGINDGATLDEKNKLLAAMVAIGSDSAVLVPEPVVENIKFMEAERTAAGQPYLDFITEQNEALMRIILGQPGTSKATPGGIGSTQADVHADVKHEIIKADSDLICGALNNTLAKWVTRWNYGPDVKPPKVYRCLDDAEDINKTAERDVKLKSLGWERSPDSFEQVYGEGYEQKVQPEAKIDPLTGLPYDKPTVPAAPPQPGANDNPADKTRKAQAAKRAEYDAQDPRPLYVERRLQNVAEFKKWAKGQGFSNIVDDLHVTVLYSRTPVDWFSLGESWGNDQNGRLTVAPGGPRTVLALGDKGAVVLRFASSDLSWRHESMIEKGASHDFDEYAPHVTITYDGSGVDLDKVEPYTGELVFGPELFEELETSDELPGLTSFTAAEEEAIDSLTASLMDETNPAIVAFAASIREELKKAKEFHGHLSVDGARVALLQAFERFDVTKLSQTLGLAFLAERSATEVGAGDDVA
jgi:phage gp29-like protein